MNEHTFTKYKDRFKYTHTDMLVDWINLWVFFLYHVLHNAQCSIYNI